MLEQKGDRLIVHLSEELDHHSTEEIRRRIDVILRKERINELEFNFSKTRFMDSAGIGMILGRYKRMQALDGQVVVSHMNEQVERIWTLSGIHKMIAIEEEAR
jgi:stage II sporulation protein AA (anti-sigma F factor antagonist)